MANQYSNRSDLRNPTLSQVATGQTYGEAGKQRAAQKAVPMGPPPSAGQSPKSNVSAPITPLDAPTNRPAEPITAGADFGAGPGAREAGISNNIPVQNPVAMELMTLYKMFPNDDLAGLISSIMYEGA